MGAGEQSLGSRRSRNIVKTLRTRGSWVQILPGAPFFKDLAAKTKSSQLLWDRCGISYPQVPRRRNAIQGLGGQNQFLLSCCGTVSGKGDHRHIGGREQPYRFISVAKLRRDFEADIEKFGGKHEEED